MPASLFIWPVGQAVKTAASHAVNVGSIPARVTRTAKIRTSLIETVRIFAFCCLKVCRGAGGMLPSLRGEPVDSLCAVWYAKGKAKRKVPHRTQPHREARHGRQKDHHRQYIQLYPHVPPGAKRVPAGGFRHHRPADPSAEAVR